ncbi:MAG: protoporphyrinogen oxidase [Gemmatimonadales bacterium]
MSRPRVAVIGGGAAGLVAGCRLRAIGLEPVLFESTPQVGGIMRTERRDGWVIDTGPCLAAEPDPVVRSLLDAAGCTDGTLRAGPRGNNRYVVHQGAPAAIPHTIAEFTSSPLLSLGGRLRLLKERFIPQKDIAEETVDAFARRRFGDEMADRVFDPLLASTCAGDPREILARYAFPSIVGHERRSGSGLQGNTRARMEARRKARGKPTGSWGFANGMGALAERLAATIGDVRTGAAIAAIDASSRGVELHGAWGDDAFAGAILAVPAVAWARVDVDIPGGHALSEIATMPHASIASVSLGFARSQVRHPLDAARLLVPGVEQRSILSAVFPSSVLPARAPDDHVLITAYLGGARRPDVVDLSETALAALAHRDLAELLGIDGEPVMRNITVWREALPQAVIGHRRRLAAAEMIEASAGAVAFAGSWRDGLSLAETMLGGAQAANRLAARRGWVAVPASI